jgi:hypothetical protein
MNNILADTSVNALASLQDAQCKAATMEKEGTMILSRMRPVHRRSKDSREKMEEIIQIMSLDLYRTEADSPTRC